MMKTKSIISPFALTGAQAPLLACMVLVCCCIAFGQSTTATLSGTVVDANGAAIPGANVTLSNTATGFERKVTTSGEGSFTIPLLPPSNYTLTVARDGFAPAEIQNVILNVNDSRSLRVELKVGVIGAAVEVTTDASLVDDSPAVGTTINRQFIENLPLNGRSFQALINLTPGVVVTGSSFSEKGQFSVNGQRADANYFTVDGVSANAAANTGNGLGQTGGGAVPATSALGGFNNLVSVDAMQEFRIQTSSYAAEFGRSPGAQVQIQTRSGTNRYSGNLFEYVRNDVFDANDYFANRNGLRKPPLRQNDFGGVLGGPLPLPNFGEGGPIFDSGKGRTFFFVSYEGLRLRQPRVLITLVPTLLTRQNAAPALRPILNSFPIPNGRDSGNGFAEFNSSFSNPASLDATSIRIDHSLTPKMTIFGRYNHAPSEVMARGAIGGGANSLSAIEVKTDTLTLGTTWAMSATISNEARFNYTKTGGKDFRSMDTFGGAVLFPDSLLFPAPFSSQNGLATVSFLRISSIALGLNVDNFQRQINLVDNFSIVRGAHSMKFGVDYRRLAPTHGPRPYTQGLLFDTLASITAGIASSGNVATNASDQSLFFTNFSAYGQDTWKASQRLTFTYGLRWDVNPPPFGKEGLEPFAVTGFDTPALLALQPRGTPLYKTTYNNFAPRFGVAYQLSQARGRETVLRGGVGIFYEMGTASAGNLLSLGTFPFGAQKILTGANLIFPLSATASAPPPVVTAPPISRILILDPELKLPRVYQWNVAVEQSLGASRVVSASYVAAVGRRLLRTGIFTNANPSFPGTTTFIRNGDISDYHALQTQFRQRLTGGLQALVSHTWSHSIDTASTDITGSTDIRQLDPRTNRGPSDFDIRHTFSAAVTYNIPVPRVGRLGKAILGGWSVDTIFSARSASPVDIQARNSTTIAGQLLQGVIRPDLIAGVPLYLDDPAVAGGRRFNRAALVAPPVPTTIAALRQGSLGRNVFRGFPFWQMDTALRRQFSLTERVKLQLRAEAFNLLNHPNFSDPVNNLGNVNQFGVSTSMLANTLSSGGGGFNPLYQIGGPRSMQFAFKLLF